MIFEEPGLQALLAGSKRAHSAVTGKSVDSIDARSIILTGRRPTGIHVKLTNWSSELKWTEASKGQRAVIANPAIFTNGGQLVSR